METNSLKGKKLLILGGAFQHIKVVESAKKMGIITYVVDNLNIAHAPAKQIADFQAQINIFDYEGLVSYYNENQIDGVLACNLDICQVPYQKLCELLNVPCFGNAYQYKVFTDKPSFKKKCKKVGVDIIETYTEEDALAGNVSFPIYVKPTEGSSSKGQSICYNIDDVPAAIAFAKQEGRSEDVLIEKYLGQENDFSLSGLVINGDFYVTRTSDRFLGIEKMNKSELVGISPSRHRDVYFNNVHVRICKFLKELKIENGPIFLQGFVDGDTIRFYDMGLRFPGAECERAYERLFGINLTDALVHFSLTGVIPEYYKGLNDVKEGWSTLLLYLPLLPGKIAQIDGMDKIRNHENIVATTQQYWEDDVVGEYYNAKQRLGEIDMVCNGVEAMKNQVNFVYDNLLVEDENSCDMLFSKFDTARLDVYRK